jgi:hypothetical protein
MKTPSSKLQAPEKLQAPSFNAVTGVSFASWNLELLWNLDFGAWGFQ